MDTHTQNTNTNTNANTDADTDTTTMTDTYTYTADTDASHSNTPTRESVVHSLVERGARPIEAERTVDTLIDRGVYSEHVDGSLHVHPLTALWFEVKMALCRHIPGVTPSTGDGA